MIDDKGFDLQLAKLKDEPIPYFVQYSQKPLRQPTSSMASTNSGELPDEAMEESTMRKKSTVVSDIKDHRATLETTRSSKAFEKSEFIQNSSRLEHQTHEVQKLTEEELFDTTQKLKMYRNYFLIFSKLSIYFFSCLALPYLARLLKIFWKIPFRIFYPRHSMPSLALLIDHA